MEEKDTDWEDERGGEIGGMVENDTDWEDGRKLGGYCRDGEKTRYGFEGQNQRRYPFINIEVLKIRGFKSDMMKEERNRDIMNSKAIFK